MNGVDPDGGLFGMGVAGAALVGAAVGATIGYFTDDDFDENWAYWVGGGALIGAGIGYLGEKKFKKPVMTPRFDFRSTSIGKPVIDPNFVSKTKATITPQKALVDMGHGKLVPASQVNKSLIVRSTMLIKIL